ncbi:MULTISPECIES: hypothetical protein [Chryseobacterium]|uniref:hypothetical protein n=1 Tax=Chryseobacterium TaxID=59732 RepID=UPI000C9E0FBC|nr:MULTISPECIES: hypothetical protein [Chryseobacterium]VXB17973.1 conserved exported hypothetical protein [Chryseobacterium sp. 8AT]
MKKFLFCIFLLFLSFSFGQKKFPTNELLNIYPFSKTSKVKIISYNIDFVSEFPTPLPPVGKDGDSTIIKNIIANQTFPIKLRNILGNENMEGIKQSKTLNFKETFELSELLYNTCGKFKNDIREISKCFFPRNAILFYDENNKVFEILEICFECHRIDFNSNQSLEINDMCNNFYSRLEQLFKENGLETQHNRKY